MNLKGNHNMINIVSIYPDIFIYKGIKWTYMNNIYGIRIL